MATYGWLATRRRGAAPDGAPRRAGRSARPPRSGARTAATPTRACRRARRPTFRRVLDAARPPRPARRVPARRPCSRWAPSATRINLADIETDPLIAEIFGAARDVLWFLAENLSAVRLLRRDAEHRHRHRRDLHAGRGHGRSALRGPWLPGRDRAPELDRTFTYPGAPYRFTATPWSARRAPLLGEHQDALG